MKLPKTQVSTGGGALSILSGFLAIYQDVPITDFMIVFKALTFGEVTTMVAPFIIGIVLLIHNEDN